jgi:phosphoribosyl 1,2-cyclic phosphodiesterase
VKITFLGTRGYIERRSRRHRRHSMLRLAYQGGTVIIDCGEDWLSKLGSLRPEAVVITHAHPDHAGGLAGGAPCPVYATKKVWQTMSTIRAPSRGVLPVRKPREVAGLMFEAFPVVHSVRAPAVGYRITAGRACLFYVPDVVAIPHERAALSGVNLYIGDGATLTRPILRRRDRTLIGHTPIRTQLAWCGRQRIPRAIFTHCGSQLVAGDARTLDARVRHMGNQLGVDARLAYDGLTIRLP